MDHAPDPSDDVPTPDVESYALLSWSGAPHLTMAAIVEVIAEGARLNMAPLGLCETWPAADLLRLGAADQRPHVGVAAGAGTGRLLFTFPPGPGITTPLLDLLRAAAEEVAEVWWSQMLCAARWSCWSHGHPLRVVDLGFEEQRIAQGDPLPFETGLWDDRLLAPEEEEPLVLRPAAEWINEADLIAAHPPGSVLTRSGRRMLFSQAPEWQEDGALHQRLPPESGWATELPHPHVLINLDHLNLQYPTAPHHQVDPDTLPRLLQSALHHLTDLPATPLDWDWPCYPFTLQRPQRWSPARSETG